MSNYLIHHGIKGMHWGVRRYQNYDGTLKHPKGKRRDPKLQTLKKNRALANRNYSKAYNDAYNYSGRHMVSQFIPGSKAYDTSNSKWKKVNEAATDYGKANTEYKNYKDTLKKEKVGGLTDRKKKAIKIGAIAATLAVGYAAHKVIDLEKSKDVINKGKTLTSDYLSKTVKELPMESSAYKATQKALEDTFNSGLTTSVKTPHYSWNGEVVDTWKEVLVSPESKIKEQDGLLKAQRDITDKTKNLIKKLNDMPDYPTHGTLEERRSHEKKVDKLQSDIDMQMALLFENRELLKKWENITNKK